MSATGKLSNMSAAEFLDWCPRDGNRWQLVDGEPVAMAPARIGHNAIQGEVAGLLRDHFRDQRSACVVLPTPGVVPQIRAGMNFRVPDLGVTCQPYAASDLFLREPLLLIEILSPTNWRDTRNNVWAYTTIPTVREIVVLHAEEPRAEILRRDAAGTWPAEPLIVADGDIELASIDFRAPLMALYRTAGLAG